MKTKRGFTLIEVMIVILIIGLFAILVFSNVPRQLGKARDARMKSDLDRIKIAMEEYEKDRECYPLTLPACGTEALEPVGAYLKIIPCDPKGVDYHYYPEGGGTISCPRWYWLFSKLETEDDPSLIMTGCRFGCGPTSGDGNWDYYVSSPNAPKPERGGQPAWGCTENGGCIEIRCMGTVCDCEPNLDFEGACNNCSNPESPICK